MSAKHLSYIHHTLPYCHGPLPYTTLLPEFIKGDVVRPSGSGRFWFLNTKLRVKVFVYLNILAHFFSSLVYICLVMPLCFAH